MSKNTRPGKSILLSLLGGLVLLGHMPHRCLLSTASAATGNSKVPIEIITPPISDPIDNLVGGTLFWLPNGGSFSDIQFAGLNIPAESPSTEFRISQPNALPNPANWRFGYFGAYEDYSYDLTTYRYTFEGRSLVVGFFDDVPVGQSFEQVFSGFLAGHPITESYLIDVVADPKRDMTLWNSLLNELAFNRQTNAPVSIIGRTDHWLELLKFSQGSPLGDVQFTAIVIPEPASLGLLAMAIGGAVMMRRRR